VRATKYQMYLPAPRQQFIVARTDHSGVNLPQSATVTSFFSLAAADGYKVILLWGRDSDFFARFSFCLFRGSL